MTVDRDKKIGGKGGSIHWTISQPRVHQAIVYKRKYIISRNIRYLNSLKVRSDYIFTAEVFSTKPLILEIDLPIVAYILDGFSSNFSPCFNYIENIKGFYYIRKLRKYPPIVIFSRIALILYKNNLFFLIFF